MSRPRLRSDAGCIRCRRRHKKCDEARPRCSYCARWNVECVRPTGSTRPNNEAPGRQESVIATSTYNSNLEFGVQPPVRQMTPVGADLAFDLIHSLPIEESTLDAEFTPCLHRFLVSMMSDTFPFDMKRHQFELYRATMESLLTDQAYCYCLMSYCASLEATRSSSPIMKRLSLEYAVRTEALLRQRISADTNVADVTILAASLHILLTAFDPVDPSKLRRMMNGVNAWVQAQAQNGSDPNSRNLEFLLMHQLFVCNILCSLLSVEEPGVSSVQVPPTPSSFNMIYQSTIATDGINGCMTPGVMKLLQDVDLALFFRRTSVQLRSLSQHEASYVYALLQSIDFQMTSLQAQRNGEGSMDEIAVLGAVLVKQEVIAEEAHHLRLIREVLGRLRHAILACRVAHADSFELLAIWSCCVTLVGHGLEPERKWFSDFALSILAQRFDCEDLRPTWMFDLRVELQQLPWHERLDKPYTRICEAFLT